MIADFKAVFTESTQLVANFSDSENLNATFGSIYTKCHHKIYDGPTTVTPTRDTQILETIGKALDANITVNPIPSNYGLITWNGSILTVS